MNQKVWDFLAFTIVISFFLAIVILGFSCAILILFMLIMDFTNTVIMLSKIFLGCFLVGGGAFLIILIIQKSSYRWLV